MPELNKNSFFKFRENRATTGYGSAWLVKKQNETMYSMLCATETVPAVFGAPDSYEFDLLNSPTKGKVQGKSTLDAKEVEVLHHRDNIYRAQQLKGQVLDFLNINDEFVGYHYTGILDYRQNDATADINRGTFTITPMSADPNPIFDCRDMVLEPLCFKEPIPKECTDEDDIDLSIVQTDIVSPTYKWFTIDKYGKAGEETTLSVSSNIAKIPVTASGLVGITVSATGYAPWTTTVYVKKTSV